MIIFSDIDGVITPKQKLWLQSLKQSKLDYTKLDYIGKFYSDHDSWVIEKIRNRLVFISADSKVNRAWAKYRRVPFIKCDPYSHKYGKMIAYIHNKCHFGEVQSIAYIGDSMPDFYCLLEATYAFVPNDASLLLIRKLKKAGKKFIKLKRNGGEGCLEEAVLWLFEQTHLLPRDTFKEKEMGG